MCATQQTPSFRIEDILNLKPKISKDFVVGNNEIDKKISDSKNNLDPTYIRDTSRTILKNSPEYNPQKRKLEISNICTAPETSQTNIFQGKRNKIQNLYRSTNNVDPPNSVHVIKTVNPFSESQKSVDLSKYCDQTQNRSTNSVPCSMSAQSLTPALSERLFNNTFATSSTTDFKNLQKGSLENQSYAFQYGFHNNLSSYVPRESAALKYTTPYYEKSVMPSLHLRNGFNYFSECTPTSDQALMLRQGFSGRYFTHPMSYYPYGLDRGQGACGFWPMSLGKRKGGQVRFSAQQTAALERRFLGNKYLSPEDRRALATSLKLTDRQVKTWFQNRRAKWRRANNLSPEDKSDENSDDESVSDRRDCATPRDVDS